MNNNLNYWTDTLAINLAGLTLVEREEVTTQEALISEMYTRDLQANKPMFNNLLDNLEELNDRAREAHSEAFYHAVDAIISLWDGISKNTL